MVVLKDAEKVRACLNMAIHIWLCRFMLRWLHPKCLVLPIPHITSPLTCTTVGIVIWTISPWVNHVFKCTGRWQGTTAMGLVVTVFFDMSFQWIDLAIQDRICLLALGLHGLPNLWIMVTRINIQNSFGWWYWVFRNKSGPLKMDLDLATRSGRHLEGTCKWTTWIPIFFLEHTLMYVNHLSRPYWYYHTFCLRLVPTRLTPEMQNSIPNNT